MTEEYEFDPNNNPEYCSICQAIPDWLEVWQDSWQCQNCGSITDHTGKVEEERRWHEEEDDEE